MKRVPPFQLEDRQRRGSLAVGGESEELS